jgi:hypothetical protein
MATLNTKNRWENVINLDFMLWERVVDETGSGLCFSKRLWTLYIPLVQAYLVTQVKVCN